MPIAKSIARPLIHVDLFSFADSRVAPKLSNNLSIVAKSAPGVASLQVLA